MSTSKPEPQAEPNQDIEAVGGAAPIASDRRAAIARMGKYAAYTAPAMLTLLLPPSSQAACLSPDCVPDPPGSPSDRFGTFESPPPPAPPPGTFQ